MSEPSNPLQPGLGGNFPKETEDGNMETDRDPKAADPGLLKPSDQQGDFTESNPVEPRDERIPPLVSHGDNGASSSKEEEPDSVSAGKKSVEAALDGLEEIVNPSEESKDEEPVPREESADELAHIIEAILFASDEPLGIATIKSVLDASHTFGRVNPEAIVSRINALNNKYDFDGSGFHIIEIAEGYQFATRKELAQWVSYLFKEKARRKLSNPALETLAIIAYKQPITKPEIESIRGVNVDYVLHNLLEKEIVTVVGRAETVGRPLLYGTTQRFLRIFGLKNLEDLPKLREIEEIIKEIRSKGAEESIQLEITALGDQIALEPSKDLATEQDPGLNSDSSSDAKVPTS
jgi:segregation and condensation protein B